MPAFIEIQGFQGAVQQQGHVGWSDVDFVDSGITNHGVRRGAQLQESLLVDPFKVTRSASDHLTPQLLQACGQRTVIPRVVLETVTGQAGATLVSRITVTNARFISVRPSSSEQSKESLVIDGEQILYEYAHPITGVLAQTTWDAIQQVFI